MDSNKLLPWGLKLSTVALSLPVNTRYASCIATAITQQVTTLQARLEALHATKLLGDDELYALEDVVADFVEYESSLGIVTLESISANDNTSKLHKLVALSERLVVDGAFVRQIRRKYV
eukprot:COSAG02_NODE_2690_length_8228_cov_10.450732_4_plen_119_part_00